MGRKRTSILVTALNQAIRTSISHGTREVINAEKKRNKKNEIRVRLELLYEKYIQTITSKTNASDDEVIALFDYIADKKDLSFTNFSSITTFDKLLKSYSQNTSESIKKNIDDLRVKIAQDEARQKRQADQRRLSEIERNKKSRLTALILCVPFGFLGIHRFYLGKKGSGFLMAITGGFLLVGWVIDFFMILTGNMTTKNGDKIKEWRVSKKNIILLLFLSAYCSFFIISLKKEYTKLDTIPLMVE